MKFKSICVYIFLFFGFQPLWAVECPKPLRVGVIESTPYSYKDKKTRKFRGIDIDIVAEVMTRMGCKYEYLENSWRNLLMLNQKGGVDILFSAAKNSNRQNYAYFSNPYLKSINALYIQKEKLETLGNLEQFDDLFKNSDESFKIGAQLGFFYGDLFYKKLKSDAGRFLIARDKKELVSNLKNKKVNGFLMDLIGANELFREKKLNESDYFLSKVVLSSNTNDAAHFMFAKKTISNDFVNEFNKTLADMKKDLVIENILSKYDKIPENYIKLLLQI